MEPTSRIEIDLTALDHNLAQWRRVIGPNVGVCAIVKADAYGLGAKPIAMRLANAGVDMLAVYSVAQAAQLAEAGITTPMLILMPVDHISRTDVLYRAAISGRLHLAVHSERQLDAVEKIGTSFGTAIPVHIEIDTGMSRLGMSFAEAERVMPTFAERRYLRLAGIFTHPASADTDIFYTNRQLELLDKLVERNTAWLGEDCAIHFAGTNAALRSEAYHKTMVRLGLGLFGYATCPMRTPPMIRDLPKLRPAVRWTSSVVHLIEVDARAGVGYHSAYKTTRPSRLAVVPVGYADGYPTALGNRGVVRVGPGLAVAPVRGEINMDQITIDVTEIEGVQIGTAVEVIADDPAAPNGLMRLSELSGSSAYELLCRMSPRVPRRYLHQQIPGAGAGGGGVGNGLTEPIVHPNPIVPPTGRNGGTNGNGNGHNGNGSGNGNANGIGHARVAGLPIATRATYERIVRKRA